MSKSVLVIDAPENCISCSISRDCSDILGTCAFCPITGKCVFGKDAEMIPEWCPLKPLPEYKSMEKPGEYEYGEMHGWNRCIDEITGGEVDGEINGRFRNR